MTKWTGNSTIDTQADLIFIGHYIDGARCYFGNLGREDADTLTKTGPGTLSIIGSQIYGPAAAITVKEGTLAIRTDPADPGYRYREGRDELQHHLAMTVEANGHLHCRGVPRYGFRSLTSAGNLVLDGQLTSASTITFTETSRTTLSVGKRHHGNAHPAQAKASQLKAAKSVTVAGTLVVDVSKPGTYTIIDSPQIEGSWTLELPDGFTGSVTRGELIITTN